MISSFSFCLQRFANINTPQEGTVLSSSKISSGTDSLGTPITSYVKTVSSNDTDLIITVGDNSTYAVTLQSNSDVFSTTKDGLVPKPSSTDSDLFLTAAGTWATVGSSGSSGGLLTLDTVASTVPGSIWLI